MRTLDDDLGTPVVLPRPPRRIVSLVPSLTEALALTVPERLVGATDWCTHPADLAVTRVRGTKNPDRAAITALAPDLVVANQEENRQLDVERLRSAGVPVWVTAIETLNQALTSMERLFLKVLDVGLPDWLATARAVWDRPGALPPTPVAVPVWRDPWMWVGARTFTGDVLARLGLTNAVTTERYPKAEPDDVAARLVLLPDEPYVFTADDGPEAFPDRATALVSGRALTWYGPSLATARAELEAAVRDATTADGRPAEQYSQP
ncbi:helical backbone metal receptor [Modestobacter sp. Leaf380]|uniref:helical backbone metal receptor n=1 Tax=Modestobacter sp. Leaf380 TaxID=1736356 RepID=UPI0006F348FD|nr:helical backbone metal receptor [Modestobacter sp. Leaf380]KQS63981.1 ABC transporter substrate-binding protein [Modestobacter sp. Leaf380]